MSKEKRFGYHHNPSVFRKIREDAFQSYSSMIKISPDESVEEITPEKRRASVDRSRRLILPVQPNEVDIDDTDECSSDEDEPDVPNPTSLLKRNSSLKPEGKPLDNTAFGSIQLSRIDKKDIDLATNADENRQTNVLNDRVDEIQFQIPDMMEKAAPRVITSSKLENENVSVPDFNEMSSITACGEEDSVGLYIRPPSRFVNSSELVSLTATVEDVRDGEENSSLGASSRNVNKSQANARDLSKRLSSKPTVRVKAKTSISTHTNDSSYVKRAKLSGNPAIAHRIRKRGLLKESNDSTRVLDRSFVEQSSLSFKSSSLQRDPDSGKAKKSETAPANCSRGNATPLNKEIQRVSGPQPKSSSSLRVLKSSSNSFNRSVKNFVVQEQLEPIHESPHERDSHKDSDASWNRGKNASSRQTTRTALRIDESMKENAEAEIDDLSIESGSTRFGVMGFAARNVLLFNSWTQINEASPRVE